MPDAPPVLPESRVRLRELARRVEGERVIVGWVEGGVFFEADKTTLRALDVLAEGASVRDVHDRLAAETGEEHDVAGLVAALAEAGLVAELDGVPVAPPATLAPPPPPARAAGALKFLHSLPFALLVLAAAVGTAAILLTDPELVPRPGSVLQATGDPVASLALTTLLSIGLVCFHELGHWAMAQSFGVAARIRVSAVFVLPVLLTDVTRAWTLPRTPRVLIFLGGMAANVLAMFLTASGVAAWNAWGGAPDGALGLARLVLFINLFQILYQLLLFLRTDLYFVLVTVAGEWNLHADVSRAIARALSRGARRVLGLPPRAFAAEGLAHRRGAVLAYGGLLSMGTVAGLSFSWFALAGIARDFAPLVRERVEAGDAVALAEALALVLYVAFFLALVGRYWFVGVLRGVARWWRETFGDDAATAQGQG